MSFSLKTTTFRTGQQFTPTHTKTHTHRVCVTGWILECSQSGPDCRSILITYDITIVIWAHCFGIICIKVCDFTDGPGRKDAKMHTRILTATCWLLRWKNRQTTGLGSKHSALCRLLGPPPGAPGCHVGGGLSETSEWNLGPFYSEKKKKKHADKGEKKQWQSESARAGRRWHPLTIWKSRCGFCFCQNYEQREP